MNSTADEARHAVRSPAGTRRQLPRYEYCPPGVDAACPQPGDFILVCRRGIVSTLIRWGERLRLHSGARWTHAAFVEDADTLIEAVTSGVRRAPISEYRDFEYVLVRTGMSQSGADDAAQAVAFASSCVGQRYGFATIVGIALRFLTPGRGLALGLNGTEICSGLVAQALVRGWANFPVNPASITPAELAEHYQVPDRPSPERRARARAQLCSGRCETS
jgi:hypothetical protein